MENKKSIILPVIIEGNKVYSNIDFEITSNDNYISDGLNNAELFKKAQEFFEVANNEIYKLFTIYSYYGKMFSLYFHLHEKLYHLNFLQNQVHLIILIFVFS